ncbi:MAG: hypothetical protein WC992_00390 [Acholeplasmataceae bacterium]
MSEKIQLSPRLHSALQSPEGQMAMQAIAVSNFLSHQGLGTLQGMAGEDVPKQMSQLLILARSIASSITSLQQGLDMLSNVGHWLVQRNDRQVSQLLGMTDQEAILRMDIPMPSNSLALPKMVRGSLVVMAGFPDVAYEELVGSAPKAIDTRQVLQTSEDVGLFLLALKDAIDAGGQLLVLKVRPGKAGELSTAVIPTLLSTLLQHQHLAMIVACDLSKSEQAELVSQGVRVIRHTSQTSPFFTASEEAEEALRQGLAELHRMQEELRQAVAKPEQDDKQEQMNVNSNIILP